MGGVRWIVDGMNVIGTRPDGWWRDRRRAMVALVDHLERWALAEDQNVTVVFERPPSPPIHSSVLEVAHAPEAAANSADDEIVRLVRADASRRDLRVVTSDGALATRVVDAGASVYLTQQPGIDPARLVLVGHSEGAMIALSVATAPGGAPAPRGLALIEPSYTRILNAVDRQVTENIGAAAISSDDARALEAWKQAGIAEIRSGEPPFPQQPPLPVPSASGVAAQLQTLIESYVYRRYRNRLGKTEDQIDPVSLASGAQSGTGSVLVTCGTKDFNTPCAPGGAPGSGVSALAAAFPPDVAHLASIENMIHQLRDIGSESEDAVPATAWPDYPFSAPLAAVLHRFLTDRR